MLRYPSGKERDPIEWQISPGMPDIPVSVARSVSHPAIFARQALLSFAESRAIAQKKVPFPPRKLPPFPDPLSQQVKCKANTT